MVIICLTVLVYHFLVNLDGYPFEPSLFLWRRIVLIMVVAEGLNHLHHVEGVGNYIVCSARIHIVYVNKKVL